MGDWTMEKFRELRSSKLIEGFSFLPV